MRKRDIDVNDLEESLEEAREEKEVGKDKEITLEDVQPLHPNEYPARNLKHKLDGRKEFLDDIQGKSSPSGLPEGY